MAKASDAPKTGLNEDVKKDGLWKKTLKDGMDMLENDFTSMADGLDTTIKKGGKADSLKGVGGAAMDGVGEAWKGMMNGDIGVKGHAKAVGKTAMYAAGASAVLDFVNPWGLGWGD